MKIEGKKVILRSWRESDAKKLTQLVQDKQIPKFTRVPNPYKLKHARKGIEGIERESIVSGDNKTHNSRVYSILK